MFAHALLPHVDSPHPDASAGDRGPAGPPEAPAPEVAEALAALLALAATLERLDLDGVEPACLQ